MYMTTTPKVDYPKLLDVMWTTRLLFWRPDPLGFCMIMQDFVKMQEYLELSVEERQRRKGYIVP